MRKLTLFAAMLVAVWQCTTVVVGAVEALGTSSFYAYATISITETQPLDFGSVIRPSGPAPATVVISTAGDTTESTIQLVRGQQAGAYAISGDTASSIDVDVLPGDCIDNITGILSEGLTGFTASADPGSIAAGLPLPTMGTVNIGGSVTVSPTADSGVCHYTVTASYP